jgi:hypothetical protein
MDRACFSGAARRAPLKALRISAIHLACGRVPAHTRFAVNTDQSPNAGYPTRRLGGHDLAALSVGKTSSTHRINNLGARRNIVTGALPSATCNGV